MQNIQPNSLKIALCTMSYGDDYRKITQYGIQTKIDYCVKHNYSYIEDFSVIDHTRPIPWSKILLLKKYLSQYDYLFWIDGDTYIMNDEIKLEDLINNHMNGKYMLIASDWDKINSGVFFLKNTEYSMKLLDEIYEQTSFINDSCWEQSAFISIYDNNWNNLQNHVELIKNPNQVLFNSYWCNFKPGDFILHFCGCNRSSGILEHIMKKYCILKREDDTEESYNARMTWINEKSVDEAKIVLASILNK